jgi:hypothetical protein
LPNLQYQGLWAEHKQKQQLSSCLCSLLLWFTNQNVLWLIFTITLHHQLVPKYLWARLPNETN